MLLGHDVNHWKSPVPVEDLFNKYGAYYLIGKATEGVSYPDAYIAMYNDWKARTKALDKPFGSFHYWRVTKNAQAQADYYREVAGITDFPPIIDVEKTNNAGYYSRYIAAQHLRKVVERVKINFGVLRPMIYTSYSHWLELVGNADFTDCDLWVANYGVVVPKLPQPWTEFKIWQYTDRFAGRYDANWFNGDENDLAKYTNQEPVQPPEPIYVLGKALEVKVNAVNVRSGPSTAYSKVELLRLGDEPTELEEIVKSSSEAWSRIGWNQWVAKMYNGNSYITYKK